MNDARTRDTSAVILARQIRIMPTLRYLATFEHRPHLQAVAGPPLPIRPAAVRAWVRRSRRRAALKPEVAAALAYLDTFKPRPR